MTFRHAALLMTLLGSCHLLPMSAGAAPIDCRKMSIDVEERICSRPDLLAKDRAISERLASLGRQCPSQKKLLIQGQKFWLRERSNCRNGEGALGPDGTLAACLAQRMDQRLQDLGTVQGCNLSPLAASYRFVDPGYIREFSRAYVGKTVSVFGSMVLDACHKKGVAPTTGVIVSRPGDTRFPARFSAMPELRKEFLCAQYPAAHWRGIVKNDGQSAYLYLTDILGEELDQ